MARIAVPSAWTHTRAARVTGRFLRKSWGALLVGAVALAVVVAAVVVPGFKVNDARLDDAAVYVVNTSRSLVGNLNMQSDELANAAPVGAANYEVIQDEQTVVVRSTSPNQISSYDPATNQMGSPATLPPNSTVAYGKGILAVANPDNGRIWFGPVDDMLRTNFQQTKAQLEVGEQGQVTVTTSGRPIGLNVTQGVLVRPDAPEVRLPFELDPNASVEVSAVGDRAVVLDRTGQRIWVEGTEQPWNVDAGSTAHLAPPSDSAVFDGAQAIYSTRAGLVQVTKDGPRSLSGLINQAPAKPLVVGNCVHAAFGSKYVKRCAGDDQPTILDIPEVPDNAELRFLRNRDSVVLNDAPSGYIWLVDKGLKLIKDWARVTPAEKKSQKTNDDTQQVINPNRDKTNQPPVARDDLNLTARVGRSTVLPILDNDSDDDGDVLTILGPPTPKGAQLDLVQGGTGLQITLPKSAKDVVEFTYTISDGRGGTATARARVKPLPADQAVSNQLPMHFRPNHKLLINQNQAGTKRALLDWRDPDGDDMVLLDAKVEGSEDEVTFTSDGTVTFQDVGKTTGVKKVQLTVSDGNPAGKVSKSMMLVEVVKGKIVPPVANADHATTSVGTEVTVAPLANDVGHNLTLRDLTVEGRSSGVTVTPNFTDYTFSFKAEKPGVYYVQYKVSNGPVSTGLVRVDVVDSGNRLHRPVAARDVVLLPPGGQALVDPLLNDSDDDGDVLVLQSVSSDPHVSIVMEQRRYLTIKSEKAPEQPITLTYWVSDGTYSTEGTIVVIPVKLVGSQKPKAVRDTVKARAGSIVSIPVLANDSSPIGLKLTLDKIVEGPQGRAWIDGDQLRVAVPPNATGVGLTYQVRDSDGQTDSASVNITVISPDAQNEPPAPVSVEARVLAGSTTRVLIPLDGIDPNGDPVRLLGLKTGPQLGRVVRVGERYLSYEAFPTSQGTDSFSYEVVDSLGQVGVGEIRIGVAPAVGTNNPPTGVDDEIAVRPGRPVHLPLLVNDYDADGDDFGYVGDNPVDLAIKHEITDNHVLVFTSPHQEGDVPGKYYVKDARGAQGSGNITVRVSKNAKNLAPVAVDDQVPVDEIVGKDFVQVPVMNNDYDPDGQAAHLQLTVPNQDAVSGEVTIDRAKQALNVPVANHAQQVRYTITDDEGASASAVVLVPGRGDVVPRLKDPKLVLTAVAGERMTLKINDYVQGTGGRPVLLSNPVNGVFRTTGKVIPSPSQLDWTPASDYVGPAALVFEVADQVPAGDKTAKRAVISIPVTVKPAPNAKGDPTSKMPKVDLPPSLIGDPPVMKIGQGEPEGRIDVAPFYRDPNGQDFRFDQWRASGGGPIKWRQGEGRSTVHASAGYEAKPGTTLKLTGKVIDAVGSEGPAELTIMVVGSTRPRPTATTDVIDDANAGQARSVSVLANDKSNLLNNTKLRLVSTNVLSGQGTAKVEGDQVVVTPAPDFNGTMTVRYVIVDATDDPDRQTDGMIRLTVRAKPGKPGIPIKDSVGDGKVTVHWQDGAANGLPIEKRTVVGSAPGGKSVSQDCQSNTCTITGLTNGKVYTFKVVQTNTLGSAESGTSGPMIPDVKPDPPGTPTVKDYGNGFLELTWPAAKSGGSPVTGYRVTRTDTGESKAASGTSLKWTGLTNGVNVTFTVAATNKRADDTDNVTGWSEESSPSAPEHPTGPPPPPTNVAGIDKADSIDGGFIILSWDAPDIPAPASNDPVLKYDVYANGSLMRADVKASKGKRQTVTVPVANNKEYRFAVVAHNRKYPSPKSAASDVTSAFGRPETHKPMTIAAVDGGGAIKVTGLPPNPKDSPWDTVHYEIYSGGEVVASGSDTATDITSRSWPVTNGKRAQISYTLSYKGKQSSKPEGSNALTPVGPPLPPKIQVGYSTARDGKPAKIIRVFPQVDATDTSNGQDPNALRLLVKTSVQPDEVAVGAGINNVFFSGNSELTIMARAVAPDGSSSTVSQRVDDSGMQVVAEKEKISVTIRAFPSPMKCRLTGDAYGDGSPTGWRSIDDGGTLSWNVTKVTDSTATPPVDDYPPTTATWGISCGDGSITVTQSGTYPG